MKLETKKKNVKGKLIVVLEGKWYEKAKGSRKCS